MTDNLITVKTIHGDFVQIAAQDYRLARAGCQTLVQAYPNTDRLIHINNIVHRCLLSEADQALCS